MSNPKPARQYTNEEAASIITRVLDRQNGEGGRISHDELLETAREIGVTTLELEAAVVEEVRLRAERFGREEERLVREEERQRAIRKLLRHGATYVVVCAFCFVIDVRFLGGLWYFWVWSVWGLAVALHAIRVLLPTDAHKKLAAGEGAEKRALLRDGKLELRGPEG